MRINEAKIITRTEYEISVRLNSNEMNGLQYALNNSTFNHSVATLLESIFSSLQTWKVKNAE